MASGTVIRVNSQGLLDLVTRLRAVAPAATTAFRSNMQAAGELVAAEAKKRAGYSSKVPGSIRVELAGGGVAVRVTTDLPEAVAIENRGRGHVRHPLFGTRENWYSKNSHPAFLLPALNAKRAAVYEMGVETIHEAFVEAGMGE